MSKKKPWRKLHIDSETFTYRVFSRGVEWRGANKKRNFIFMTELTGWSWEELERASWKGYLPAIRPGQVKEYIINFLGSRTKSLDNPPVID